MKSSSAKKQYENNIGSMLGNNSIGKPNMDQYNFVKKVEEQLKKKRDEGDNYNGKVYMIKAPAGCGKTFCLETIFAFAP